MSVLNRVVVLITGGVLTKTGGLVSPTFETFILIALHGPRKTSAVYVLCIVVIIQGHSHHDISGSLQLVTFSHP